MTSVLPTSMHLYWNSDLPLLPEIFRSTLFACWEHVLGPFQPILSASIPETFATCCCLETFLPHLIITMTINLMARAYSFSIWAFNFLKTASRGRSGRMPPALSEWALRTSLSWWWGWFLSIFRHTLWGWDFIPHDTFQTFSRHTESYPNTFDYLVGSLADDLVLKLVWVLLIVYGDRSTSSFFIGF